MIRAYLRAHRLSFLVGNFIAFLLGIVSAILFATLGNIIQVLFPGGADAPLTLGSLLHVERQPLLRSWFQAWDVPIHDRYVFVPLFFVGLAAVRGVLTMSHWFMWERLGEVVARDLRADLMSAFLGIHAPFRRRLVVQEEALASAITQDIRMIREYIVHFFGSLPRELFQIVAYLATLIFLSPKLFLIFFLGVLPVMVVLRRLGKKLRKRAGKALEDYARMTEWLQQRLFGAETIKHYRTESLELAKMSDLSDNLVKRFYAAARVKARTSPLLEVAALVALAIVMYIALSDLGKGMIEGGDLFSFYTTLGMLGQSGSKVGKYFNSNKEGNAAISRVENLKTAFAAAAQTPANKAFAVTEVEGSRGLSLQQLRVRYGLDLPPALDDTSVSFQAGRVSCLCGHSGAGKSTVMNAILGMEDAEAGCIRRPPDDDLGYLPQKVVLAPTSIAGNVAYPDETWDEARVWEVLHEVGLGSLVEALPEGILTQVGRGGLTMSGGQEQRLMLARLLYKRFAVVLIDEGTSALDPVLEQTVYQSLHRLARDGAAVIMIAHRPTAFQVADDLVLLEHGRLVAHGTRQEVMASPAFRHFLGE